MDTRWCGDITYIPTNEGWLYLATVIDIASRRIVGWATSDHLGTSLAADALKAACHQRQPEGTVVFHSDRVSQGGFNRSSQHLDFGGVQDRYGGLEQEDRRCARESSAAVAC
ncbi:transposase [Streptomyces sp. NPDC002467]|uniref:transposase n=1 Tax=Streptomyces sp. NPDC002467 TaxID=3364647 RepID=UPI0036A5FB4B